MVLVKDITYQYSETIPFELAEYFDRNHANSPNPHPMAASFQDQVNKMNDPRDSTYDQSHNIITPTIQKLKMC